MTLLLSFFLSNNQTVYAVVETHSKSKIGQLAPTQPAYRTGRYQKQNPTFFQKIGLKIAQKCLKKYQKSLDNVRTKGDKFAQFAFLSTLIIFGFLLVVLLLLAGSSFNLLGIFIYTLLINIPSLLVAIIALTRDDLSARSKKMAKWAIAIDLLGPLLLIFITKKFL